MTGGKKERRLKAHLNTPDVITGVVAILDEQLNFIPEYKEFIRHEVLEPVEGTTE